MPRFLRSRVAFLLLAAIAAGVCAATMLIPSRSGSVQAQAARPGGAEPAAQVAVIDGQAITMAELERELGTALSKLEEDMYNLKRERLEAMIGQKLLEREAARRGISVQQLVATEITGKISPVTQQDVDGFFEANKARLPADRPDIKDQIRKYLESQRSQERHQAFLDELRKGAKVEITLSRPPVRRAEVNTAGAPVRGNPAAPVAIVEFSDFHCPFCKRIQPTLMDLLKRYPDKVKLVYKDMPLDSLHPTARTASEAARCAGEQGKFWEYHDKIYAGGPDVSPEYLKKMATEIGIDAAAFETCVTSDKHQAGIQQDLQEAAKLGLSGTPAFFINGRPLSGAQPLEAFVKIIEEELTSASGQP